MRLAGRAQLFGPAAACFIISASVIAVGVPWTSGLDGAGGGRKVGDDRRLFVSQKKTVGNGHTYLLQTLTTAMRISPPPPRSTLAALLLLVQARISLRELPGPIYHGHS